MKANMDVGYGYLMTRFAADTQPCSEKEAPYQWVSTFPSSKSEAIAIKTPRLGLNFSEELPLLDSKTYEMLLDAMRRAAYQTYRIKNPDCTDGE